MSDKQFKKIEEIIEKVKKKEMDSNSINQDRFAK